MINWKVRLKNKAFWAAAIPAALLLLQTAAAVFGVSLDFGETGARLLAAADALFAFLAVLGVVNDPTTAGLADSAQAMTYQTPKAPAGKNV